MRIVIDMQGAQSSSSRHRGIGRYTLALAKALVRNRGEHEIILALSGHFPDSIEPIREAFTGLLPTENIRVWQAPMRLAYLAKENGERRIAAELLRESFLASLKPDLIVVSSLFEGCSDDAVTSIRSLSHTIPTAVILYDLIPLIHRRPYLDNPAVKEWYEDKLNHLRRADLLLSISESSRQEGLQYLGFAEDQVVNISTATDPQFRPLDLSQETIKRVRFRYHLHRPFIMYTGGIDHRKNIEGLITAYAKLPASLLSRYQLAIICSIQPAARAELEVLARKHGLNADDVVMTGFVPEDDLIALYNLSELFIFPSLHEGFGLPALEAMACGCAVIGSNCSSIPEVIGCEEALFDPHSDESMTLAIEHALSDESFLNKLRSHGKTQAMKFSWDQSARRAIAAMEQLHAERRSAPCVDSSIGQRPRLAYVSPLPPEKSGIADYSAELLPELAKFYEIDVIVAQDNIKDLWINANCRSRTVQWFAKNSNFYDRVLYHFGNSTFHQHMFDLLKTIPGVVVLHDFFLSGIIAYLDTHGYLPGCWTRELYKSHGYTALYDRFKAKEMEDVIWGYPCSLDVIQNSLGVIVHSPNSVRLAEKWYGGETTNWSIIPLLRKSQIKTDKIKNRNALNFNADDFLVCSFGILAPTKLNMRLLKAWLMSPLAHDKSCHLVFVGENHPDNYGQELLTTIRNSGLAENIHITGWVDADVFQQYLDAADVGVQLRTLSRGETSAAVLDCMNYGLATIVNANGSMADLDDNAVWKLPNEFSDDQLIEALQMLWQNSTQRRQLGGAAREIIISKHNPRICAEQYCEEIEQFYQIAATGLTALQHKIADIYGQSQFNNRDLIDVANAISLNFPPQIRQKQLLIDLSGFTNRGAANIIKSWLLNPPAGFRVELVYNSEKNGYLYARQDALNLLECPAVLLRDEPIDFASGDILIIFEKQQKVTPAQKLFYQKFVNYGGHVKVIDNDLIPIAELSLEAIIGQLSMETLSYKL